MADVELGDFWDTLWVALLDTVLSTFFSFFPFRIARFETDLKVKNSKASTATQTVLALRV